MSKYLKVVTDIKDPTLLEQALAEVGEQLGFEFQRYATPQPLVGYQGDQRANRAEFIIRKRFVGRSSNDMGWAIQADGTYALIISEFDKRQSRAREIVNAVADGHATVRAESLARAKGYTTQRRVNAQGQVQVVLNHY